MSSPVLAANAAPSREKDLAELARRVRERPLDFVKLLPWQRPLVALALGLEWRSEWGPGPSCPPSSITVVAANQIGKSTAQGVIIASHVTGRSRRFPTPGEVWGGMPRLADSVATQRRHVEAWLGTQASPRWWPTEANTSAESLLRTLPGWVARFKAFEQALITWESRDIQAAYLDEPAPDEIHQALRVRTMRHSGLVLSIFTPIRDDSAGFHGTRSKLYEQTWGAWTEYRDKHPGAKWGEVRPGEWVFALGIMENAESRGGYLPDERILADRQRLIDEGKPALALVRYGDPNNDWRMEWVDMDADSLLPHEQIREWSDVPQGGFAEVVGWIDPAVKSNEWNCETAIAIAARARDGRLYLLDSQHGHWKPEERHEKCADVIARHGFPNVYMTDVTGDIEFMRALNKELMARGGRACVQEVPGVPDKVLRCNLFAPMIRAGQVHVRPEHEGVKSQARKASAQYIRGKGLIDALDAAMGAMMQLVKGVAVPAFDLAVAQSDATKRRDPSDRPPEKVKHSMDWIFGGGNDLLTNVD